MARLLDELVDRPEVGRRPPAQRLLVIVVTCAGAALLLPWIGYLSMSLPPSHSARAWNVVWVGFDIALAAWLAATGWWVVQRRQVALLGLAVTATLLACDAWFDVCLAWNSSEQASALVSAALVEFPAAVLMGTAAVRILRRSALIVGQLRGCEETPRSVWGHRFVMLPPGATTGGSRARRFGAPPGSKGRGRVQ